MIYENLEDASEIIDNILTQPLKLLGSASDISLLEAAERFVPEKVGVSELRHILLNFLQFPEPAKMMLREMEILQEELS